MIKLNLDPSDRELRLFGGLYLPAFLAIVLYLGSRWGWWSTAGMGQLLVLVPLVIGIVGWLRPRLLLPVFLALTIAGYPVGLVMSNVLLTLVFFFVVTPIGLLLRLQGKDPLERRFDPAASTYWQPRPSPPPRERYAKQF